MRLLRIEIESFGKLSQCAYDLGEGLNLFEGANESGKSTLLAFLRFAFYGFPRRVGAEGEEREKRISWHTQCAAGRLTLKNEQGAFCITRRVVRQGRAGRESFAEQLSVISLLDNESVELCGKTPGEYFLGLPATLYDSTLCLRQSDAARVSTPEVGEAVGELLFSGNEGTSADTVLEKLDTARRELQHRKGRGGRIAELEDDVLATSVALEQAKEQAVTLGELERNAEKYRVQIAEQRERLEELAKTGEQAGIAQLLQLFSQLHEAEELATQRQAALAALQADAATLPDEEEVRAAREAFLAREAAIEAGARMTPEMERLRAVTQDEQKLRSHQIIQESGGAEVVWKLFSTARLRAKRFGGVACALLVPGILLCTLFVLLATGALHTLLQRIPATTFLPTLSYALLGTGGALMAVGMIFLLLALRARTCARTWQRRLHVREAAMFRTYLQQCESEAEAKRAHEAVWGEMEQEYKALAKRALEAEGGVRPLLARLGYEPPAAYMEQALQILDGAWGQIRASKQAMAQASVELERALATVAALRQPLEGQDEERLRRRFTGHVQERPDLQNFEDRQAFLRAGLSGLEHKLAECERQMAALRAVSQSPAELQDTLLRCRAELANAKERYAALQLAITAMNEAVEGLQKGLLPTLCDRASEIFATLTDGAYTALYPGKDLSVMLDSENGPLPLSHFSAGCRDAAHLSLRLALLSTLCNEPLPLLLDEVTARLDDTRADALLLLLRRYAGQGGQCLLFSCHSRERRLLQDAPCTFFAM